MSSLFERYRPTAFADVVGQDRAVKLLSKASPGGKAWLFAGPSGTGKTTLARILAETIAEPYHVEEIDAQDATLDFLRGMEHSFAYRGMGEKTGKAWIINECHGMRSSVVSRCLTLLEAIPAHCTVIFTTTRQPQVSLFAEMDDADPFVSRCLRVPLAWHEFAPNVAGPLTKAFAKRAMTVARTEGLDGQPIEAYEKLILDCKHNLRRAYSEIECGCMVK